MWNTVEKGTVHRKKRKMTKDDLRTNNRCMILEDDEGDYNEYYESKEGDDDDQHDAEKGSLAPTENKD